jgi:hypothetical protein
VLLDTVGIAGCVTKMGADALDCVAGIDGSVFNLYPKFQEYIKEGLAELGVHCAIESSADGSGQGAAVIVATTGNVHYHYRCTMKFATPGLPQCHYTCGLPLTVLWVVGAGGAILGAGSASLTTAGAGNTSGTVVGLHILRPTAPSQLL